MDTKKNLTSWDKFCRVVEEKKWPWPNSANARLSRANSRFRAASCVELKFSDFTSQDAAAGHAAIFRLAIAYTPADALKKAISKHSKEFGTPKKGFMTFDSEPLANSYRSAGSGKLRQTFKDLLTNKDVLTGLDEIVMGSSNNVAPIAAGVRHLALHGEFAPATIGYSLGGNGGAVSELFDQLYFETLSAVDEYFSEWVDEL